MPGETATLAFSATITDQNGTVANATLDLTSLGGGTAQAMTGSGTYTYSMSIDGSQQTLGAKEITLTATDNEGNQKSSTVNVHIVDPPEPVVLITDRRRP